MSNQIFEALAQYGFGPVNDDIAIGTWQGYAVTLRKFSGKVYYVYFAVRLGRVPGRLRKDLNAAVKEPGVKLGGVEKVTPNYVICSFNFSKANADRFPQRMDRFTQALEQNNVPPADTCAITGAPNPDSLCLLLRNDFYGYQPVCASAIRLENQETQDQAEDNANSGSYLFGLVGALLGALLGVAVNLLTIVLIQRIFALLFALVPVGAMFGYKLFKGKMDKAAVAIVLVLSLLAVPLMEFLSDSILLSREFDAPIGEALSFMAENFFEPEMLKETGPEMLKMLGFMALGFFIGWTYLRGQLNSTQTKQSQLQVDTLHPNPLYRV